MSHAWGALVIVAELLAFVAFIVLLLRHERKQARTWKDIADGEFDRAEYGHWTESRRSGSMVHTTTHYRMTATAVFFTDGRSYILDGRHDLPWPRGTRLQIRENQRGNRRIFKVEQ